MRGLVLAILFVVQLLSSFLQCSHPFFLPSAVMTPDPALATKVASSSVVESVEPTSASIHAVPTVASLKQGTPWALVGLLCVAHYLTDNYSSIITPLMPMLAKKLAFDLGAAGQVMGAAHLTSSLFQPFYGWASDQLGKRWPQWTPFMVPVALTLTAGLLPMIGRATTFTQLTVWVLLGYIGIGLFHPIATGLAHRLSPPEKKNWVMSLFMSSGMVGFSTGPILASELVARGGGLHAVTYASALGAVAIPMLLWNAWAIHRHLSHQEATNNAAAGAADNVTRLPVDTVPLRTRHGKVLLGWLWANNVCRAFILVGFATFLPFLWSGHGYDHRQISWILSLAAMIGGPMGVVGGRLADKWLGEQGLLRLSFIPALVLMPVLFFTKGWPSFVAYLLMAGLLNASMGANMVMALRHIKGTPYLISGVIAGWSFGLGGVLMMPVGQLADAQGPGAVMWVFLAVALLGLVTIEAFPRALGKARA